ncbi:MAG TPA: DUF2079 domain-containing protein [Polyangiaceae bacterium]|jgi:hypothetical protein|nr:DUF2079 domain-containing protein [Polyangiaceae bacterium]
MNALSRPKRFLGWIDRVVLAVGALGVGAFGWPFALGIGLGAGLFGIVQPKFVATMTAHRATMDFMKPALIASAVAVVVVALSALVIAWLRRRRTGTPLALTYVGVLKSGAFLTALPLVVALTQPIAPGREWLALLFILTTAALVAYSAYQTWPLDEPLARTRRFARAASLTVVVAAAAFFAWKLSRLGIANHLSFGTGRADLGLYVSRFREASEGRLFACTLCESGRHSYLHLEPIVALLSPIYLASSSAQTLIVLQALILASGAIAAFFLAERLIGNVAAAALAVAYLAYPPLQEVALFDFHAIAVAVPLALWLLYALETERVRTYLVLAALLLLVREDTCFVLFTVGIYALASPGGVRNRLGWATLALSLVAVVVMHFAAKGGVLATYDEVISDFTFTRKPRRPTISAPFSLVMVQRIFSEGKALHAAELLSPLLALPLLVRGRVLLLYGGLLALLATGPLPVSPNAHQVALLIPFLFALTVKALGALFSGRGPYGTVSARALGRALTAGILVCSLLECYELGPIFTGASYRAGPREILRVPTKDQVALDANLQKLAGSWPKGTKVAASSILLPHLGRASRLYTLDDRAGTDYVVLFMKQRPIARRIEAEETAGQLVRVASYGDAVVYRARYRARLSRQARQLDDE